MSENEGQWFATIEEAIGLPPEWWRPNAHPETPPCAACGAGQGVACTAGCPARAELRAA